MRAVLDERRGVVVVLHLRLERRVFGEVRRVELRVEVLEQQHQRAGDHVALRVGVVGVHCVVGARHYDARCDC